MRTIGLLLIVGGLFIAGGSRYAYTFPPQRRERPIGRRLAGLHDELPTGKRERAQSQKKQTILLIVSHDRLAYFGKPVGRLAQW